MAIMKNSPLVGGISGNVGGVNFVNAQGGQVIRPAKLARHSLSEAQQRQQSRLSQAVSAWHRLQPEVRRMWRQFAEQWKRRNRLGIGAPITGYNLYLKHVLDVHLGTPPANFSPPSVVRHIGPTDVTVSSTSPSALTVEQSGPPIGGDTSDLTARLWLHRFGGQSQVSAWNSPRRIADIENPSGTLDLNALLSPHDIELLPYERIGVGIAWRWCDNTFAHVVWAGHTVAA